MHIDLTVIWAFIIAFAVFAYVVLDGFDLGIGILFPTIKVGERRDHAMNSIAPVWDGNETWLVLGGGGMLAAFPLAYSIILPATYPLIIAMLLGLIFRGVAFEFRWRDVKHQGFWDRAFFAGSLTAAICQGMTLGAIVQGIRVEDRAYAGGWLDWLTPFSLLTGASVVVAYTLLGSTWLVMKMEGDERDQARATAKRAFLGTLAAIAVVSLASLALDQNYVHRWFDMPGLILTALVPVTSIALAFAFWRAMKAGNDILPFVLTLALFFMTFIGLGISIYPNIVPPSITIWDAATAPISQSFMLYGVVVAVPLILGYTGWSYWVFRGKTGSHGYHH